MKIISILLLGVASVFAQCPAAPSFPDSIATDATLGIGANRIATTLKASMASDDSVAVVSSGTGWVPYMWASIDSEIAYVTAVNSNQLTMSRGCEGTTPAAHKVGATVVNQITAASHELLKHELEAVEKNTGPVISSLTYNVSPTTTAGIQEAVNAAPAAGTIVFIPAGVYTVSSSINITKPITIQGTGKTATIILTTITSGCVFCFSDPGSAGMSGGGVRDLTIEANPPVTGTETAISLVCSVAACASQVFTDLIITQIPNPFILTNCITTRVTHIDISAVLPSTGVAFSIGAGHDRTFEDIVAYNPTPGNPAAGFQFLATLGDHIRGVDMIGMGNCFDIEPTGTNNASWSDVSDTMLDSCSGNGLRINPASGASVTLWRFNNMWMSSNTGDDIYIGSTGNVQGIYINGGDIRGSTGNGANIAGGHDIQFNGVRMESNVQHGYAISGGYSISIVGGDVKYNSLNSSNTYDGINVTGAPVNLTVSGVQVGNPYGDSQRWGFNASGTGDYFDITGNTFWQNTTGQLRDTSSGAHKVYNSNSGVDDTPVIIASAATLAIPANAGYSLTGTTTVTNITGNLYDGRVIRLVATNATPANPTLNTGGNIASPVTLTVNQMAQCTYSVITFTWFCTAVH